jgi:hypothetical protein
MLELFFASTYSLDKLDQVFAPASLSMPTADSEKFGVLPPGSRSSARIEK